MFTAWREKSDPDLPVYEQIVCYIKTLINDGVIINGDKLMSQRDLCSKFGVSRPTVAKALEILEHEGIITIESKRKSIVTIGIPRVDHKVIDWDQYTKVSFHQENAGTYKKHNFSRSNPNYINLFETYFGHDFSPLTPVIKAMGHVQNDVERLDRYSNFDVRGTLSLRQAVCDYLLNDGIEASTSQVIICHSLHNAYYTIFNSLCNQNTNCYVEQDSLFLIDKMLPVNLRFIPMAVDSEGISVEPFVRHLKNKRKGVLFVDPEFSMPSGISHSLARRKQLLKTAGEWQTPIIESVAVKDCWHNERPGKSFKALDVGQNVVHIFSLARPFMFAPITAIVAPEAVIPAMIDVKLKNDVYTDVITQAIFEKLLTENIYRDYMDFIRPDIIKACDETEKIVAKYFTGIARWKKPSYGVSFRLEFDYPISECFSALEKEGILLYSPNTFHSCHNFIWFCYTGVSLDKLDFALGRVAYHVSRGRNRK